MPKQLYLTLLASILLPVVASAQIKPGPSQLVCVLNPDETPAQLAQEAAWKNPNVQGVLIRESWSSLEPTENNYDFSLFDKAAELAHQNGKFIGLQVGSGTLSPEWIYKAGARPFAVSGGHDAKMPLPWDAVFQDAWGTMIEALGARYDGNSAVRCVMMTGTGRDYDSSLASNKQETESFQQMGGPLFWTHAAGDIAEYYTASFPHTHIIWSTAPVFPGPDGQRLVDSVAAGEISSAVGQFGVTTAELASESFGTLSSLVSSKLDDGAPLGLDVETDNDPEGVLTSAVRNGAAQNSTFVMVAPSSITNGSLITLVKNQTSSTNSTGNSTSTSSTTSSTTSNTVVVTNSTPSSTLNKTASTNSTSTGSTTSNSSTANTANTAQTQTTSNTTTETPAQEAAACTQIAATAMTLAKSTKQMWLTSVPGGAVGAGTQASPLNVYTSARLYAALFNISNIQISSMVVHFTAGTFYTGGNASSYWGLSTNWQFLGAGQGQTILKLDPTALTYTSTNKRADEKQLVGNNGSGGYLIENMTIDGNCTGCGSGLLAGFTMPAPRQTVTVSVADSIPFTVGKWVYVQDSVATGGVDLYYALMEVSSKPDATHLVLKNSAVATGGTVTGTLTSGSAVVTGLSSTTNLEQGETVTGAGIPSGTTILYMGSGQVTLSASATASGHANIAYSALFMDGSSHYCPVGNSASGTTIPATAHVLVDFQVNGIYAGGTNNTIENVTVQNTAEPSYEGPAGIWLNGYGTQTGSLVQNCTIQSVWGTNGWLLVQSSTTGVKLMGNTIKSNGYQQGIAFIGGTSSTIENNTVTGCAQALFSDTNAKTNLTVSGNTLEGLLPIDFGGASVTNSSFSNNQLIVTQNNGWALQLYQTALVNDTFSKNTMTLASGVTGARDVNITRCTGSSGNVFTGNVVSAALELALPTTNCLAYGTQTSNVTSEGETVSFGLAD